MAKSPLKNRVECPHCGFQQMEYAAAKNTLCRQCGKHFVVSAAERVELVKPVLEVGGVVAAPTLLERLWGMLHRPCISSVVCFDCGAVQELNSAASSTICPSCSVHMDLRDYKINTPFSRAIRTHGKIHVTSAGDLSSSSVLCRSAVIDGKLRGSLQCTNKVEFRAPAKVQGKLSAGEILIGKKADVQFFRTVQVGSVEIRGRMSGEIVAETLVTIRKTGSLEGNVVARAINVEKGGRFSGQLIIGQNNWGQAELIPEAEETNEPRSEGEARRRPPHPYGLPARPSAAA